MTPTSWKKLLASFALVGGSLAYAAYLNLGGPNEIVATNPLGTAQSGSLKPVAQVVRTLRTVVADNSESDDDNRVIPASSPAGAQTPAQAPSVPVSTPAPVSTRTGIYTDGSYTGSAANAYYGTVQVKATISGGRITDVAFLQYPSDRSTSREISNQAMPILKQEAISVQNANVDIVSGATATSEAFQQSLGDALAKAKA